MDLECSVCDGLGCEFCAKVDEEHFPLEFFYDWADAELERLVLDCMDELKRRAGVVIKLERSLDL